MTLIVVVTAVSCRLSQMKVRRCWRAAPGNARATAPSSPWHTRALWWNKAHSLSAGRGVYCAHKLSNKNLEVDGSMIIFQPHLSGCVAALADGQAEGHACCATKVVPPPRQCLLARG